VKQHIFGQVQTSFHQFSNLKSNLLITESKNELIITLETTVTNSNI
jgi:hypothetical protein